MSLDRKIKGVCSYFEHQLWDLDWVACGTVPRGEEVGGSAGGVGDVVFVVGGVEVFTVPAATLRWICQFNTVRD